MYQYRIDLGAVKEDEEAYNWYEKQSELAADNFKLAVNKGIVAICADPFRNRNFHKNLHELSLKKYPFNIIYFIEEEKNSVTITSIFHHKRNPKKKFKNPKKSLHPGY